MGGHEIGTVLAHADAVAIAPHREQEAVFTENQIEVGAPQRKYLANLIAGWLQGAELHCFYQTGLGGLGIPYPGLGLSLQLDIRPGSLRLGLKILRGYGDGSLISGSQSISWARYLYQILTSLEKYVGGGFSDSA